MKIFITGASGAVGQALIKDLIAHGHSVVGLARSQRSASAIGALGAEVVQAELTDLQALNEAARASDGVVHLAFELDFMNMPRTCANDRNAISALAEGIAGTAKPLVGVTSTLELPKGVLGTEDVVALFQAEDPSSERALSGHLLLRLAAEKGFRGAWVRFSPSVHGKGDAGMVPGIIAGAKSSGFVPCLPEMKNVWPAVSREDTATLLRLILENGTQSATYHAVAETVPMLDILTLISKRLNLPLQSGTQEDMMKGLGFYGMIAALDNPVSSDKTRKELGWAPAGTSLLSDMEANYF